MSGGYPGTWRAARGWVLAGAAAAVWAVSALVIPVWRDFHEARTECKRLETGLERVRENLWALSGVRQKRSLSDPETVSAAVDEITKTGKAVGIHFVSVVPGAIPPHETPGVYPMPIEIGLEASYTDLGVFLGSLDELKEGVVTVEKFHVSPDAQNAMRLKAGLLLHLHVSDFEGAGKHAGS